jgi:hypothetical protein
LRSKVVKCRKILILASPALPPPFFPSIFYTWCDIPRSIGKLGDFVGTERLLQGGRRVVAHGLEALAGV